MSTQKIHTNSRKKKSFSVGISLIMLNVANATVNAFANAPTDRLAKWYGGNVCKIICNKPQM